MTLKQLLGDFYKDGMSLEDIETALKNVELPKDDASQKEIDRLTAALSKSNAEAAENKRKLRERQSEEEKEKADRDAQFAAMQEELENLRKERTLSDNKAQLLALGYDEALAAETAEAMASGDTAKLFVNQRKFIENERSKIKAEILQKTPTPPAGGKTTITKEEFAKAGYEERVKLFNENPALYNELVSSEN